MAQEELPNFEPPVNPSGVKMIRDEYHVRIHRPDWREAFRPRAISNAGGKCQQCGKITDKFEVHHLTYERLGRERDEDLMAVCLVCHPILDRQRRRLVEREADWREAEAERKILDAQFDGFCRKAFPDGELPADAWEQFEEWLERKEEKELTD